MGTTAEKLSYLNDTKLAIKQAIENKGIQVGDIPFRQYADKIYIAPPTPTTPTYTGHVDSEGLTAIGWTTDDIAYYQANVTWNEEQDEDHLVSDYDKQIWQDYQDGTFVLPTVFSNNNKISTYYPYIEHCPKFDTSNVTNASYMFNTCYNLVAVPVIDTSSVTNLQDAFNSCHSLTVLDVSNWDTSSVTTLQSAFNGCHSLTVLDVSNWDTSSVTTLSYAFYGCHSLTVLDVSNWDTSSVTTLFNAFSNCSSLTVLDVLNWDTSSVTTLQNAFSGCHSLTVLDVSNWDVSSVATLSYAFSGCYSLTVLDVSNWDVSSVTNLQNTFYGCYSLTVLDVSNWDTSSVTTLSYAFYGCYSLTVLDVSNWDVSSVTNLQNAFSGCYSLTNIIGTLNLISITSAQTTPFTLMYSLKEINVQNLGVSVSFTNSPQLSYTSIMYMINNAKTVTDQTLTLGRVNLAKLTDEEIAIATNKGWTLV